MRSGSGRPIVSSFKLSCVDSSANDDSRHSGASTDEGCFSDRSSVVKSPSFQNQQDRRSSSGSSYCANANSTFPLFSSYGRLDPMSKRRRARSALASLRIHYAFGGRSLSKFDNWSGPPLPKWFPGSSFSMSSYSTSFDNGLEKGYYSPIYSARKSGSLSDRGYCTYETTNHTHSSTRPAQIGVKSEQQSYQLPDAAKTRPINDGNYATNLKRIPPDNDIHLQRETQNEVPQHSPGGSLSEWMNAVSRLSATVAPALMLLNSTVGALLGQMKTEVQRLNKQLKEAKERIVKLEAEKSALKLSSEEAALKFKKDREELHELMNKNETLIKENEILRKKLQETELIIFEKPRVEAMEQHIQYLQAILQEKENNEKALLDELRTLRGQDTGISVTINQNQNSGWNLYFDDLSGQLKDANSEIASLSAIRQRLEQDMSSLQVEMETALEELKESDKKGKLGRIGL